ncbi:isocitrate lyase/PEP mutase family protein [Phytohabitans rumicis]|uniref:2-methylisocitrate lyase n=1 Tax=Phytohabitans rumicis TaxID=1076125 RepID=A0A6V8LLH2_9ACTN|nr:isocitrate lyase/phosphoenolpyruvate mutase family protein [Phytohabitans rumicis]GFJ94927.1 2-methylisocitrate lyase [Phytohabitans rumicis]
MTSEHLEKTRAFHALHVAGTPLVLPNAWDVASACLVEEAGAAAVATTSAGVAWSLGAPDGDLLDRDRAIDLVARVVAAVDVPVTADIESGFGADPAGVADTIRRLLDAGASGVNIEDAHRDGLRPVDEQAARIAAARQAADAAGIPLFVNVRVDTYLLRVGDPATRLRETLDRASAYVAAGADGVFVPGVTDPATVAELSASIAVPLNILAGPGAPTIAELGRLGAARVSVGSSVALSAYGLAQRAARELFTTGTYDALAGALDYGRLNELLRH